MSGKPSYDNAFVEQLLAKLDQEYRLRRSAESRLAEMSDVAALKEEYERKLADKDKAIAGKDKAIADKDKTIADKDKTIADKDKTIADKEDEIIRLNQRLQYLLRKVWGRMSEKSKLPKDPRQLEIDFGETDLTEKERTAVKDAQEAVKEMRKVHVKEHDKLVPVRKSLPEELPRKERHVYPEGYIGHEDEWVLFKDTEVSESLEITTPELYVLRTVRHKGMLKKTKKIRTAPVPVKPLERSYAGSTVLTELTVGKYFYHIPFYRQLDMFKKLGMKIPQSTVELWFHGVADLLLPLYMRIKEIILSEDYVESDETTEPIVDRDKKRTVKGYLWTVRAILKPLVFFHYHDGSRAGKVALEFFKDYRGALQVDGYAVYDILDKFDGIIILCCWAHARRYFDRALNSDKERAEYALSQISMLYTVESVADEKEMDYDHRKDYRQQYAYPIIRGLEAWAKAEYEKVLPKSPIGKAMHYLLVHIRQLSRYTLNGKYRIDNNLVENSIRPVAVGRKGYLFCGNHRAAEDAAIYYTMMGCCKLANVDPKKWMLYFLNHIHEYDNDNSRDVADFLPLNLKEKGLI